MRFAIPNYQKLTAGSARIVALSTCSDDILRILEQRSLYEYAASREDARILHGRGPVYAVTLPGACGNAVIRHSRRGGLLARFNDDLFLSRLRPVRELITSYRLRVHGVPTPELVAYVMYPVGMFFRYDVASREVEHAADLAEWLGRTRDPETRVALLEATAVLLAQLAESGAHHADLNAKNILLAPLATGFQALVIDVDRVRFHVQRSPAVMQANFERLARSLRKLALSGLPVIGGEIVRIGTRARQLQDERIAIETASKGRDTEAA